MTGCNKS